MSRWSISPLGADLVQSLQKVVSGEFDVLVPPLRRPVHACDQSGAVDSAEIAVDECMPGLGVILGPVSESEKPLGVLVPRVGLQVAILVVCTRLHRPPVTVENILSGIDESLPRVIARSLTEYLAMAGSLATMLDRDNVTSAPITTIGPSPAALPSGLA
jgi:hypothetical protein